MPRLFVAIDLPEDIKDRLLGLREHDLPPARWSRREALHLTLRFIGEVNEAKAERYAAALDSVRGEAFEMRISGVGQFPINQRPRVIWAGVENRPALRDLHAAVNRALSSAGLPDDGRRFQPHITLMRFRKSPRRGISSAWIREHVDFFAEPFVVSAFALYESDLQPGGAVYTKRAVYGL